MTCGAHPITPTQQADGASGPLGPPSPSPPSFPQCLLGWHLHESSPHTQPPFPTEPPAPLRPSTCICCGAHAPGWGSCSLLVPDPDTEWAFHKDVGLSVSFIAV